MAAIDHLVFASPDVAEGVSRIRALTGAQAVEGGRHVGLGTHNHLLGFDEHTYFEIIGVDPDQPDPESPRPFGLDDLTEPALVGYAIHPSPGQSLEQLVGEMVEVGLDPGPIIEMSRRKPDGELLSWRLATGGDNHGGVAPFAIEWADGAGPARTLPSMGSLQALEVSHPDDAVRKAVLDLGAGVSVNDGPTAGLRALVDADGAAVWVT